MPKLSASEEWCVFIGHAYIYNNISTDHVPACFNTFVEIDHEIIARVVLHFSTDTFKNGCCQLQAKECAQSTGLLLSQE